MFDMMSRFEAHELIAESESFLNGCFAEHLLVEGAVVPTWAWMNLLAHGTPEDVAEPPVRVPHLTRPLQPWVHARAYLARELTHLVAEGTPLATLQRDTLVPLELELMRRPHVDEYRAADWVGEVLAALERRSVIRRAHGWS